MMMSRSGERWWSLVVTVVMMVLVVVTVVEGQKNLARPIDTTQFPAQVDRTNVVVAPTNGKRYGGSTRNDVRRYGASPSANGSRYNGNGRNGNGVVNGNGHNGQGLVNGNGYNGVNGNGHHVHDGHRMITRALWRIFDALMQKKDHAQLYGRVGFVEEALKKMISVDSQLEGEIDKLKEEVSVCRGQLSAVLGEVSTVKTLGSRLAALEAANPELLHQGDQEHVWNAAAAYTTCPHPFTRVGSECFYVSMGEMLGWEDARGHCARLNGDLASPRDLPALRDYLTSVEDRPEYLWVGGSLQEDGTWEWATGSQTGEPVDMSKDTWNEEVPSGSGKCMGLFGQSSFRAYNYDCKERDFFVCQYNF